MIMGIKTEISIIAVEYFGSVNEKFQNPELVKNPFINSKVYFIDYDKFVLDVKTIYPKFTIPFFIVGVIGIVFAIYWLCYISIFFILLSEFLFSKYLIYIVVFRSLRKKGYAGKIILLKNSDIIDILLRGRDHGTG